MVTGPINAMQGVAFTRAPYDSAFGKVFQNNMDRNSFSSDLEKNTIKKQIALMISNSKTAMYHFHDTIFETQEYRNCQVSKKIDAFVIYYY